jgi:hypothetical protein
MPHKTSFSLRSLLLACLLPCLLALSACTPVKAEDRIFLDLSLDFLGEYRLPKMEFANTPVGGLSALTYDRSTNRFYVLSDDRSDRAPARFYTLKLNLKSAAKPSESLIQSVEFEQVTSLKDATGQPFAKGSIDPEGIALTPQRSLYISSEGSRENGVPPFINEFDLATGQQKQALPIPQRFLPAEGQGIRENQGFEPLTLSAVGFGTGQQLEPLRLFAATESALQQDLPPKPPNPIPARSAPIRFLHYLIGETGEAPPTLIAEHLYLLDEVPKGTEAGLTEIVVLDQAGHFLSLERSFDGLNPGARLFQIATGGANDTSSMDAFAGNIGNIVPILKEPLLDLTTLGIALDNLEGMSLGPRLPDGTQSLLMVSDDNFNDLQATQFLLFRLRGYTPQ